MTVPIIGNDPGGFRPDAPRHVRGRVRGRRFRYFVAGGLLLGGLGMVAVQTWLWSGETDGKAPVEIRQAKADVPNYAPPPPELPEPIIAAEPKPEPAPPRRAAPRRVEPRRGPARDDRPTQIAWDVSVRGNEPDMSWFADGRRPQLAKGCALRPGASVISAALETKINSEVPGQVIATVTEDVYDADGVGRLLVPQGTKVVGVYTDELEFQSRRMGIVWTELTMPDGTQLALADSAGMDAAGQMGMGGEVHTNWGTLIATAALLTVFDGIQRTTIDSGNAFVNGFQYGASLNAGRLGKEVTNKVLDWKPTITVPAGTQVRIAPTKTVQVC